MLHGILFPSSSSSRMHAPIDSVGGLSDSIHPLVLFVQRFPLRWQFLRIALRHLTFDRW
jgi:hypothetical protein